MASVKEVTNHYCSTCGARTRLTEITSVHVTKSGKTFPDPMRFIAVHHCIGGELKK